MMVFVIVPKTDAEVNQLVSLLHSQKVRNITHVDLVAKGKQTVYWAHNNAGSLMFDELSEWLKADILKGAEPITVNQLGAYFNQS